jgi:hypothetical protein
VSAAAQQRSAERSRAAKLARYYRDEQGLKVTQIVRLLRAVARDDQRLPV